MKKNLLNLFAVLSVLMTVLVMAEVGNAQTGSRKARGRVYTKADVGNVIKRVETRLDNFVDNFDTALDNSGLNGSKREDNLNDRAKDLERATDELTSEFSKRDAWIENKDQVRKCLNIATDLNVAMKNRRFDSKTEKNWANVKYELNTLAKIYNLPQVGSSAY
jgi:hypothetical protein